MIFGDKSSSWNKIINAQSIKSEFHVISDFNRKPNYCSSMYVVINVHDQFKQYFDAFFFVLLFYDDYITIINSMFLILYDLYKKKKKILEINKKKYVEIVKIEYKIKVISSVYHIATNYRILNLLLIFNLFVKEEFYKN